MSTIDLTQCVSDRLVLTPIEMGESDAPHDFRNTVTVECLKDGNDGIDALAVEFVIASTSPGDLPVWVRELNRVLEFVRVWRL